MILKALRVENVDKPLRKTKVDKHYEFSSKIKT